MAAFVPSPDDLAERTSAAAATLGPSNSEAGLKIDRLWFVGFIV